MTENHNNPIVVVPSGLPKSPPHPLDAEWHIHHNSQTYGPYTGHKLREFATEGRIGPDTEVLRVGRETWCAAEDDRTLAAIFPPRINRSLSVPPPASAGPVSTGAGATIVQVTNNLGPDRSRAILVEDGRAAPKSAGVALLLSILIVGAGQLYNGQVGKGILMFVLCIGLWFALLGWIINIWSWIDAYQTASRMNDRYQRRLAAGLLV